MGNILSVSFLSISIMYSIFMIILFFSKRHIKTYETKLYGLMIISNLVGLLLEFACVSIVNIIGVESIISVIMSKIFLLYLLFFGLLIVTYVLFVITLGVVIGDMSKYQKKIMLLTILLYLFFSLLIIILPIELYSNNGVMYSYGMATNVVYIGCLFCSVVGFYSIIKNRSRVNKKKLVPLVVFMIGMVIATVIQKINPALTLATSVETLALFIMFHTIENPDVKMIEQLELAKEQAEKANHSKTDFLSSMSHEIRTPLNAIVGFSDCIMSASSLEEAKENAKDIVNASSTLLEIVNGILDISKIEAGKLEIVNSKYNSHEVFGELAKLITPRMKEKGLDFTYYIDPVIPKTLYGDHANIKKIITNLLSNACKYTDKGFVRYEVNCVKMDDYVRLIISVEDSGRGIKKESIDKLFTKFQRLEEDRNTTIEGTGLGLAITKQLAELMGGKVICHTVYGEGSKFTAVINQRISNIDTSEVDDNDEDTVDLSNVSILIVDDTPLNIKVTRKLLEKYNALNVDSCDSGFSCIEKIKKGNNYDIILMDDMMPKMSGTETLAKLKEFPDFKSFVVALTANALTGMKEKYIASGFDDYLSKPIDKYEFVHVISSYFDVNSSIEILDLGDSDEEEKINDEVIPVDENIEEILGNKLDLSKKDALSNTDIINIIDDSTTIDNNTCDDLSKTVVDLIPVVDINYPVNSDTKYDVSYLEDNGCDINHALELLGDMEMFDSTVGDFLEEIDEKWDRINKYLKDENMEDYAIDVHSLKSDCKYLGFMKLADISYQHELKSKENDLNYIKEHFNELETEYKRVIEVIKNYNSSLK